MKGKINEGLSTDNCGKRISWVKSRSILGSEGELRIMVHVGLKAADYHSPSSWGEKFIVSIYASGIVLIIVGHTRNYKHESYLGTYVLERLMRFKPSLLLNSKTRALLGLVRIEVCMSGNPCDSST